jgi:uncharacterized protein YjbJ (UPF0337 family)
MNETFLKGNWHEIKGSIQKAWGNLTDNDLDRTEGDLTRLAGLLQQKFGIAKEEAHEKLTEIFSRHPHETDTSPDRVLH